jgi:hypothetical protein
MPVSTKYKPLDLVKDRELIASMPQPAIVLNHLVNIGSITDKDARDLYGITRLADVIYKLKRRKPVVDIETVEEIGYNRWGKKIRYGRYVLKEIEDVT